MIKNSAFPPQNDLKDGCGKPEKRPAQKLRGPETVRAIEAMAVIAVRIPS